MKTVALRFSDNFAPAEGTIQAHIDVITKYGYVWYGKLGLPLSQKAVTYILSNPDPVILLIHSGKTARYWAHVSEVHRDVPDKQAVPEYYRNNTERFRCWFKIKQIDPAPKDVLSRFRVISSGAILGEVSRSSLSPFFIIETEGEES